MAASALTREARLGSYEIVRMFGAPREEVFAAWVTPGRLARWFGPRFTAAPVERIVLDARRGGEWQVTLTAEEGFEVTFDGAYREVSPPERLVFTVGPAALVTVELTRDDGGGTVLRFHESGPDVGPASRRGWSEFLDRLAEHLAEG